MNSLSFEEIKCLLNPKHSMVALDGQITGVSIDSRKIKPGDLFIAIESGKTSGANYAKDAINRGASLVISERDLDILPLFVVEDSIVALNELAGYYRNKFNLHVIGVTGSIGKTTVKDMLYLLLSAKFRVVKNEGNLNNLLGLPLSIFNIDSNTEYVILEMGMNHLGEIDKLAKIAKPDIGIITTISPCHMEYFNDIKEVLIAKLELYKNISVGGLFILNEYDTELKNIEKRNDLKHITVGNNCDYHIDNINELPESITFNINNVKFDIPLIGRFNAFNACLSIALSNYLGVELSITSRVLKNYKSSNGRMNIKKTVGNVFLIDDTYNANPNAFGNVIDYIDRNFKKNRYAVIGDMLELGKLSGYYHRKLGENLKKAHFNKIFYSGDFIEAVKEGAKGIYIKPVEDNDMDYLREEVNEGDVILFKASRGIGIEIWINKFLQR